MRPKALLDKIEQVVRLIRSKGVGVYFVTQNPLDVPDKVLAQLGNRVQHALRAFTPRDQKAVRAAAETFRANPKLDTAQVITELGKGEALVSFLEGNGTPSMVERCMIRPPCARVGPITPEERKAVMAKSPVKGKYDHAVDPGPPTRCCRSAVDRRAPCPGRGARRETAEAQPLAAGRWRVGSIGDVLGSTSAPVAARKAAVDRPSDHARSHPLGHQPRRRPDRRRHREVDRRQGSSVGRAIVRGTLGRYPAPLSLRARHLDAMACCPADATR